METAETHDILLFWTSWGHCIRQGGPIHVECLESIVLTTKIVSLPTGYRPQLKGNTEWLKKQTGRTLISYCVNSQHDWNCYLLDRIYPKLPHTLLHWTHNNPMHSLELGGIALKRSHSTVFMPALESFFGKLCFKALPSSVSSQCSPPT